MLKNSMKWILNAALDINFLKKITKNRNEYEIKEGETYVCTSLFINK